MFELKFPRNQSFPGIAELWAVKALVWTTKPTGSPTPESRKSTQPKRVPAACLFYTEMCIFGHICPPFSRKPKFSRHSGACGLRVPPLRLTVEGWHSQTTCTAMPGKLWFPRNRGTNMPENAHFRIEKACRGYPLRLGTFSTFGSWRPSGFCSSYKCLHGP